MDTINWVVNNKYFRYFLFSLLGFIAVVSVVQGFYNAQQLSQDFQWSPTVLLLEGSNPYSTYLKGDPNGSIIKAQAPNYAHSMYLVLIPFGLMEWETAKIVWATLNVVIGVLIVLILSKSLDLSSKQTTLVLLIFLASTPFRNGLGNGQQGLIMLFAFTTMLLSSSYWASATAGCGYFKYSFAPPFAAYLLFERGYKHFFGSLIPGFVGFVFFWLITDGSFFKTLIQPLYVSSKAVGAGKADLMTIIGSITQSGTFSHIIGYYLLPLILSIILGYIAYKYIRTLHVSFAFISATSLLLFKHLNYDFVFLLPAFALSIKYVRNYASMYIFSTIIFIWFGWKAIYELTTRLDALEWLTVFTSTYVSFLLVLSVVLAIPFTVTSQDLGSGRAGISWQVGSKSLSDKGDR